MTAAKKGRACKKREEMRQWGKGYAICVRKQMRTTIAAEAKILYTCTNTPNLMCYTYLIAAFNLSDIFRTEIPYFLLSLSLSHTHSLSLSPPPPPSDLLP